MRMRLLKVVSMICCFVLIFLMPSFALATDPDAYESDDSPSLAKPIPTNNTSQHHNFHSASDTDWISFTGVAGRTYGIRAFNVGTGCDIRIELYDSSGVSSITYKDAKGPGQEEYFDPTLTLTGTYFVKASFVGKTFTGVNTEYDISVEDKTGDFNPYITGYILNASNNMGIKGASISSNGQILGYSQDGGFYYIRLTAGDQTITFHADGYQDYPTSLVAKNGVTVMMNIGLPAIPSKTYYKDADNDGYSDGNPIASATRPAGHKLPEELIAISGDCDDSDPSIHPGVPEVCDGKDNNCNGQIDEGFSISTYYRDVDGDGYGNPNDSIQNCSSTPPYGYVTNNGDCNDADSEIHPVENYQLPHVIMVLQILSGIELKLKICTGGQTIGMQHAIIMLQKIAGVRG